MKGFEREGAVRVEPTRLVVLSREKLEEAGDNARMLLNLRKRMARIRVFDPACGSGGMFVQSARFVAERQKNPAAELAISIQITLENEAATPQKYAVDVKPSRIDGQGAYAAEPVPARRKIGEIRGESISVREARQRVKGQARIMMVEISDKRAIDATHSTDPLRYTNHACQPNTVLRIRGGRVELYAMRAIKAGEELVADYGETHHDGKLRCRCGMPGCRGAL